MFNYFKKMNKEEFIQAFNRQYGYICVSNEIIGDYYDKYYKGFLEKGFNDDCILDFCQDFLISQGMVEDEDIVE